jgi:hypothetical protein
LRTAIIGIGAFVIGILLGASIGIVAGTIAAPQASSPRTVTETRYVTVVAPEEASAPSSPSASASASVQPGQATKECQVGKKCDLGTGAVLIQSAQRTNQLSADYSSVRSGNFVVIDFAYTYQGQQPVSLGEIPWTLTDSSGSTYTYDFDATNTYSGYNENIIYEKVQPGVQRQGKTIFSVAPDAKDLTLTITDLANPQGGEAANVEL